MKLTTKIDLKELSPMEMKALKSIADEYFSKGALEKAVIEEMKKGRGLFAIKRIKVHYGCGLKEANMEYKRIIAQHNMADS